MRWQHWLYTLPLRLRSVFRRADLESELDEELRDHVERQAQANLARGMPEPEARRAAMRSLGGMERRKEECRDALGWRMLDTLRREGKHAVRRLARDWQFSAGAILILALGIGANTAVFSILNNTLFLPAPFHDSKRLVNIYQNEAKSGEPEGVSYPAFLDLQRETAVFEGVAAYRMQEGRYQMELAHGTPGGVHLALFEYVSANYLDVLGMRPSMGRWFTSEEERKADPVAVMGWQIWSRDFGADPNIVGRTVRVSGMPIQVIGVGPMDLNNSQSNAVVAALWMPVSRMEIQRPQASGVEAASALQHRDNLALQVRARLLPGVSIRQARAAMDVTARRLAADYPDTDPKRGITVLATDDVHVHPRSETQLKAASISVLTVVGLVLAIACSNLATLLLVRSSARTAEISVRLALGATPRQLVRHLLMESLILSLAGALLGIIIADGGLHYLATLDLPLVVSMQPDHRVLGFAIAIAAVCGIGFGLTPALQVTRVDLAGSLREQHSSSGHSLSLARGWFTMKNALIIGQVAASFLLLMGAVLAIGILTTTEQRSVGYRSSGLAMIEADPRYAGYDMQRARAVFEEIRRRVQELPGVDSVLVTTGLPAVGQFDSKLTVNGTSDRDYIEVEGRWADPGYFEAMGVPLLYGRGFDASDVPKSREVVVVSEAFARTYFGAANAVGKQIRFWDAGGRPAEIVGIAGNTRSIDMVKDAPQPFFYRSATQAGVLPTAIVAGTSGNDSTLVSSILQELRRLHPELPVINAETMEHHQSTDLLLFRVAILSLSVMGGLGLTLAAVGLYAVVALAVAQRSNEIGIRVALGARSGDLTWLVVRDVTALVVVGMLIGSVLSWIGLAVFKSSVGPVLGVNLVALVRVALIIVACGAAAAYVPARRAILADPLAAIRHE